MASRRTASEEQAHREAGNFWTMRKIRRKARKQKEELEKIPKPRGERTVKRVGSPRSRKYLA